MTDRTITGSSFSDVPETCANRIALFFASGVYIGDLIQKQNCQPAEQCSSWSNSFCVCILFPSSFFPSYKNILDQGQLQLSPVLFSATEF